VPKKLTKKQMAAQLAERTARFLVDMFHALTESNSDCKWDELDHLIDLTIKSDEEARAVVNSLMDLVRWDLDMPKDDRAEEIVIRIIENRKLRF
jgi:hypothetical protein